MTDPSIGQVLTTFGGLFLVGLLADLVGRRTLLPRVTLLLLCGFLVGPSVLDWLPPFTNDWFPVVTDIALAMIGFLLGHTLTLARLKKLGRVVLTMSASVAVVTALLTLVLLTAAGVPLVVALLLAGIATATDPAAGVDVVRQYEAKGTFTDTFLGIVAIDDAWGLLIFTLLLAAAQMAAGGNGALDVTLHGAWEIGGAIALGLLLGLPLAHLTGRVRPGEPTQAEALGAVLLCAGIAEEMGVSYVLSAMILGAVVANAASHHNRPFHAIEGIEWPFLILFFLLAGAAFEVTSLARAGLLAAAYIGVRIAGRMAGAEVGGRLCGADAARRHWMGLALLPQAGLAIGMALLASQRFPEFREQVLPVVLASTIIFELVGPMLTRWALLRAGELNAAGPGSTRRRGAS